MTDTDLQTVPGRDELLRRAHELLPELAANAGPDPFSIDEGSLQAIRDAGFLRLSTPRAHGGYEVSLRTLYELVRILGGADASTAWVVGVYSGGGASAAGPSEREQAELFADGPDVQMCGSGTAASAVRAVDGGYVVSGRWPSASGSGHAAWANASILAPDERRGRRKLSAVVPIDDLARERTWDAGGMRGAESETLVADELFIPEHRLMDSEALESEDYAAHPPAHDGEARYRAGRSAKLALGVTVVPLGAARAALDYALGEGTTRAWSGTIGEAMERLMTVVGSGAFSEANPLERRWRDVSVASRDGAASYPICREIYGRALLGQDPNISRLAL